MTLAELKDLSDEALTTLVNEKVMGWTPEKANREGWRWFDMNQEAGPRQRYNFDPLKRWNDTMFMVERMQDLGFIYGISSRNPKGTVDAFFFRWEDKEPERGECNFTEPHRALCIAALRALGV